MKWFTAIVGGLLVFFGATALLLIFATLLFPQLFTGPAGIASAFVVAITLGSFAGYHSFRASLKSHDESEASSSQPRTPFDP